MDHAEAPRACFNCKLIKQVRYGLCSACIEGEAPKVPAAPAPAAPAAPATEVPVPSAPQTTSQGSSDLSAVNGFESPQHLAAKQQQMLSRKRQGRDVAEYGSIQVASYCGCGVPLCECASSATPKGKVAADDSWDATNEELLAFIKAELDETEVGLEGKVWVGFPF